MRGRYDDITSRIGTPPLWWDENGVPRYEPFDPTLQPNIYADEYVLFLITCQTCGKLYHVGASGHSPALADQIRSRSLRYGEPPRGCSKNCTEGPFTSSEPRQVLEYWHFPRVEGNSAARQWTRIRALEVDITPDWVDD